MTYINRFFCLFSILYFVPLLAITLVPATVVQGSMVDRYVLNAIFYILYAVFFYLAIFVLFSVSSFKVPSLACFELESNVSMQNVVCLFSALALLGLILVAIDRIVVRGIDYSLGLRMARYQWLNSPGGGFIGVFGNLLVSFSYAGLFMMFMFFDRIRFKPLYLILLFACVVGHAALNGGRSNLLVAIFIMVIGYSLRAKSVQSFGNKKSSGIKYFIFSGSLAFVFVSAIIYSSAKMGGVDLQRLLYLAIRSFGAVPDEAYFSEEHSFIKNLLFYVFAYLYHGSWSSQVALDLEVRQGFYSIATMPILILNSYLGLGLNLTEKAFDDIGAFMTLPGALYYDFGWLGVIFGSIVLALGSAYVIVKLIASRSMGFIVMVLYSSLAMFMFMSLILPAYGLVFFYYAVFSLLAAKPVIYIFFKKRIVIRRITSSAN